MKRTWSFLLPLVAIVPLNVRAYTDHSGTLLHDEVWTAVGSPHVLRSTTVVPQGVRLVIEAGATVAASDRAQFVVDGVLNITGTADRRVLVTGLDQNQWEGIVFGENSEGYLTNTTFATSSQKLMRVVGARVVALCGDSLQYSPIAEGAVGLDVDGGSVEIRGGVVVSPLAELYSISLLPAKRANDSQFVNADQPRGGVDIHHDVLGVARGFALEQNYPNPFNPKTTIRYGLASESHVVLTIHDISGAEVRRLVDGVQQEGTYAVDFLAGDVPSGVYFYRLQSGQFVAQRRMLLLK